MSPSKHGFTHLGTLIANHQAAMQDLLNRGTFVTADRLSLDAIGSRHLQVTGVVECINGIHISVKKDLVILEGAGVNAVVKGTAYSYNVVIGKLGVLLRYDSPHWTHNLEHHVHRYAVLEGDVDGSVELLPDEEDRPHPVDVIAEVEAWYYENLDEVIRHTVLMESRT